jgi:hypothetical protein
VSGVNVGQDPEHPSVNDLPEELPPRCSLDTVEELFLVLVNQGDRVALRATLAAAAANLYLPGDPIWLMLVSGSSTGKTETAMALRDLPAVVTVSTLSGDAALLSGTRGKERARAATGGLLRRIPNPGILLLKDFTSILSLQHDTRAKVLAALREVFDGRWDREVGTDGGMILHWEGHVGMVTCSTTQYDRAHAVISQMGDRFMLVRLDNRDQEAGALVALDGSDEKEGRDALAEATLGLLGHPPIEARLVAKQEDKEQLARLANFVTQARSPVARDYRGEIELIHDREGPYRFLKQLHKVWQACGLLGMNHDEAWQVAARIARDSLPLLRWRVCCSVMRQQKTAAVAVDVGHPTMTTRRALEDLTAHAVVVREKFGGDDTWTLAKSSRPAVLALLSYTDPTSFQKARGLHTVVTLGKANKHGHSL